MASDSEMEKRVAALLKFREQIEEGLQRGGNTRTFTGLMGDVIDCSAQVFYSDSGVVVSQIQDAETGHRVIHIWLVAGELEGVLELTEEAVAWGKSMGADVATSTGRRGWERVPAVLERGWKPDLTLYTREI